MLKPTGKPVDMIIIGLSKTYGLNSDDAADLIGSAVELILIGTLGSQAAECILAMIMLHAAAGLKKKDHDHGRCVWHCRHEEEE